LVLTPLKDKTQGRKTNVKHPFQQQHKLLDEDPQKERDEPKPG